MEAKRSSEVSRLLRDAHSLSGRARVEAFERAARIAVASGDDGVAFDACWSLVEAAVFSGFPERAFAPFERCLAYVDRKPGVVPTFEVLWAYKWIATFAPQRHAMPRARIEEMLDDMERRYSAAGHGPRAVLYARCVVAAEMGETRAARLYWQDWTSARRDGMENCEACELDEQVSLLVGLGHDVEAVRLAGPLLRGEMVCAEVPERTYARVLLSLLRLGRVGEAGRYHEIGYRVIADNPAFLAEAGNHMEFLAATGSAARAAELFEKHLPWAIDAAGTSRAFDFYLSAIRVMDALLRAGARTVRLRLPDELARGEAGPEYPVERLRKRLLEAASVLAEAFDARNGNSSFTDRLAAAALTPARA